MCKDSFKYKKVKKVKSGEIRFWLQARGYIWYLESIKGYSELQIKYIYKI
jgi:hypothetical protein